MKKLLSISILLIFAVSTHALEFLCGQYGDTGDQKNVKWSTCIWTNSLAFKVKPLPSKPGPNDVVTVRHGGHVLTVDVNPEVKSLRVGDSSTLVADKRNIRVKQSFFMPITRKNELTLAEIKNSTVEVKGSLEYTLWHKYMNAGTAELRLENTKMKVKGDLRAILAVNPNYNCDTKAGFEITLIGNSVLEFGGGALLDSIIKDDPAHWYCKFKFIVKNGMAPMLVFDKDAEIKSADIDVEVQGNLKTGSYVLAEFAQKKSGFTSVRSVKFNGKSYTLGSEIPLGKNKAVLKIAASPKDRGSKIENDLVLEVK